MRYSFWTLLWTATTAIFLWDSFFRRCICLASFISCTSTSSRAAAFAFTVWLTRRLISLISMVIDILLLICVWRQYFLVKNYCRMSHLQCFLHCISSCWSSPIRTQIRISICNRDAFLFFSWVRLYSSLLLQSGTFSGRRNYLFFHYYIYS